MARIPYSKLKNLRSGQTVWRVCGHMLKDGSIDISVETRHICGKKVLYNLGKHGGYRHQSMLMVWKRAESLRWPDKPDWMYAQVNFLNDLQGLSCFDSRRSAERFVKEVHAGLHPEIIESMELSRKLDDIFDSAEYHYYNHSDEDYFDDGGPYYGVEGDGHDTPREELFDSDRD